MLSAEDDPADTIKPRLLAAGANCDGIFIDPDPFSLDAKGLDRLEAWVVRTKAIFVIIDPVFAYIGGKTNVNADNEIRQVLSPLKVMAAKYKISVLLVRHLTKAGKDKAIYRGSGSMGFTGAARSVLLAGRDVKDKTRLAVIHIKCNVAQLAPSLGYKIESEEAAGIRTARTVWTGESKMTAEDILGTEFNVIPTKPSALTEAEEFLRRELKEGPRAVKALEDGARCWGFSNKTLGRAKTNLGIESVKNGKGHWTWRLPKLLMESANVEIANSPYPEVLGDC